MRLFISYARVDKPYCIQIANVLNIHDIWLDDRLYAGQRWWQEIMRRLDWCEGFVYLISPDSLESEYCRKEYELAVQKGKQIFPVLIHPDAVLPDDLKDIHYADLSKGLSVEGVSVLLNAIHVAERNVKKPPSAPTRTVVPSRKPVISTDLSKPPSDPMDVIGRAAEAMEAGRFDEAVFMLKRAIEHGLRSRFIDIEALLREAEAHLDRQSTQRDMEREYNYILELVKRQRTRKLGLEAFSAFRNSYPNYDLENIAELYETEYAATTTTTTSANGNGNHAAAVATSSANQQHRQNRQRIPLLEWCEVSSGALTVVTGKNGHATRDTLFVDSYYMSKYPVTNAQFQLFLNDPQGYANPRWWDFSPFARTWRAENIKPVGSQFQGDERPRENVTWYEAMAFCNWLTEKIGARVTLPTRQQWQRAAKGDDGRTFPWGPKFDINLCNTRESRIRQTTLVMRYPQGISPFGIYDMAGNVWEWCLNGTYDDCDPTTNSSRAVQGGSYISAQERAENNFNFVLSPEYHYGSIGFRLACQGR